MKKKILSISLAIALVTIIGVGATLAYFTDTKTVKNTFTVGNVSIGLTETKWDDKATHQINADAHFEKNPVIVNDGTNPAYIRVKVAFSKAAALYAVLPNAEKEILPSSALKGYDPTKWETVTNVVDKDVRTVTLIYKGTMAKDVKVTVFEGINFPTTLTNAQAKALEGFTIDVTADAIQAEGFDNQEAAFVAFDAK